MVVGVNFTEVIEPFAISSFISEYLTDFVMVFLDSPLIILPRPSPSPTNDLKITMMTIAKIAKASRGLSLKKLLLLLSLFLLSLLIDLLPFYI